MKLYVMPKASKLIPYLDASIEDINWLKNYYSKITGQPMKEDKLSQADLDKRDVQTTTKHGKHRFI